MGGKPAKVFLVHARENAAVTKLQEPEMANAPTLPSPPPIITGYERGKAKRRRLILDTALKIISEHGAEGLTIRGIAMRASISPVTVTNLFGSKHAILKAIYEQDYQELVRYFNRHSSHDALSRFFDLGDLSTEYYNRNPRFYQGLFRNLVKSSDSDVAIDDWLSRSISLRQLLAAAVSAGQLSEETPIGTISSMLIRLGKGVTQEWVDNYLTSDESRVELGRSAIIILQQYVTELGETAMNEIRKRYSGDLRKSKV